MIKTNKILLSIASLFIIVLIISLTVSFLKKESGITGKVLENEDSIVVIAEKTCKDSDNGKDYFIEGFVDYCNGEKCSREKDLCSGKTLRERYCNNEEISYEDYECESECDSGACINLLKDYKHSYSGGSGGGSSEGRGGVTISAPGISQESRHTYNLGELNSEHSLEIIKGDNIKFSIGAKEYLLKLEDNTETQMTMNINSAQQFILSIGEEKNIDLDNDGTFEISLRLKSINIITQKISLFINLA